MEPLTDGFMAKLVPATRLSMPPGDINGIFVAS
jgi:hypothetical protein